MADASHELRTPVTTARTAATVAPQQPHRDEKDYRETLEVIEQQAARLPLGVMLVRRYVRCWTAHH